MLYVICLLQYANQIWDASSGALLRTLTGHTNDVYSVAFKGDSNMLATGSGDKSVKVGCICLLWDVRRSSSSSSSSSSSVSVALEYVCIVLMYF